MSNITVSPNMGMPIPVVGQDPGPDYASNVNTSLLIVDNHDHSGGSGVRITPSGLLINADLPFGTNNATQLRSVRFASQGSPLSGVADVGCLYESLVDLWFNDGNGNQIRITQSGGVVGTPGSITNLTSPASATYVPGTQTFVWQSAANTAANMDNGSVIIRQVLANAKGITLSSPNSLAADYTLTFMPTLPGSVKILTVDNSGNISSTLYVDNVTLQVASNVISVKDQSITQVKLAPRTTGSTVAAGGVAISSSFSAATLGGTGTIPTLTVTITTTGRPVRVFLQSADGVNQDSFVSKQATGTSVLQFTRGGTEFKAYAFGDSTGNTVFYPSSTFDCLDLGVNGAPGTYTYNIVQKAGTTTIGYQNVVLMAYEI